MTYNLTFQKTTDGQSPAFTSRHPDGYRAVIESVTGTVANGETLTINGHFSAKRNGDFLNLISTTADSGESVFAAYNHTQADSFIGSGSSLMRVMHNPVGSSGDPQINIGTLDELGELYVSYLYKANFSNYGIGANNPQIKMVRVFPLTHSSEINFTLAPNGEGATYAGGGYIDAGMAGFAQGGANLPSVAMDTWVRNWIYIKKNTLGRRDGSFFYCHKVEATKNCIFDWGENGKHTNDQREPDDVSLTPFFTPRYFYANIENISPLDGPYFRLPFFVQGGVEVESFIDGLILNDSPESVWLVDSADVDAAMATGKAVHLPSSARSETQITATCYLADMTTADNIYAVVFNRDGKRSDPLLVRAAV